MKTSRAFTLAAAALVLGFFAARWSFAQPSNQASHKAPAGYDWGALQQLTAFVSYLEQTKQTNTLKRFDDYMNASQANQTYAELGTTLAILQRLRDGRTNQAYQLLEGQMDADIVGFVTAYRQLPPSVRDQPGLKILQWARDYRARFPSKHKYPTVDEGVANAFKVLDEKK
jgi:hypothetical protein